MADVKRLDFDDPALILDEETLAAIDEGIRDAEAGRAVPIEDVRKLLPQWITDRLPFTQRALRDLAEIGSRKPSRL